MYCSQRVSSDGIFRCIALGFAKIIMIMIELPQVTCPWWLCLYGAFNDSVAGTQSVRPTPYGKLLFNAYFGPSFFYGKTSFSSPRNTKIPCIFNPVPNLIIDGPFGSNRTAHQSGFIDKYKYLKCILKVLTFMLALSLIYIIRL